MITFEQAVKSLRHMFYPLRSLTFLIAFIALHF